MTFWTYSLTSGSINISSVDGAAFISLQADSTSGSCTIIGGTTFKGLPSNAVALTAGQGLNLSSTNTSYPLDGITITWVSGTIDIVVGF